jgi:hypothetical protein
MLRVMPANPAKKRHANGKENSIKPRINTGSPSSNGSRKLRLKRTLTKPRPSPK